MFHKSVIAALAVAALGTTAGYAGTASTVVNSNGQLSVQATIAASCTYNIATNMDFKTIQTLAIAVTPTLNGGTEGAIKVACDSGQEYALGLGQGQNFSTTRQMANGANRLGYELYVSAGTTQVFGDAAVGAATGASASASNVGGVGSGITNFATITIFGKIPAGTKPAPGGYSDSVVVAVAY